MGELVSLCEHRRKVARAKQEELQQEIDDLLVLVEAWMEFIGKPELKPFFVPLEDHLQDPT